MNKTKQYSVIAKYKLWRLFFFSYQHSLKCYSGVSVCNLVIHTVISGVL